MSKGADLNSTNGAPWHHTPLHQACYHGRYEIAKVLVELGGTAQFQMESNPCGRGAKGWPIDLARGGGHQRIVELLERSGGATSSVNSAKYSTVDETSICLVTRSHHSRITVDNVFALQKGEKSALTFNGNYSIGPKWKDPRDAWGQWSYIDLGAGVTSKPMQVKFDGNFIVWNDWHGEFVFDISMWRIEEGNHLVLVKGIGAKKNKTKNEGDCKGRKVRYGDLQKCSLHTNHFSPHGRRSSSSMTTEPSPLAAIRTCAWVLPCRSQAIPPSLSLAG